jgi:CRISPR-associated endonuclease/helicase Cas3
MFYAHSENDDRLWHPLTDHLHQTADLMCSFAHTDSLRKLFYTAGILHDAGKFQDAFQLYLKAGGGRKIPHAVFGALIARQEYKKYLPLPFAIDGHHSGLPDVAEIKTHFQEIEDGVTEINVVHRRWKEDVEKFLTAPSIEPSIINLPSDKYELELVTRYLFSALTDADWLDTERHFDHTRREARISLTLDYDAMVHQLKEFFSTLPTDGPINKLRTEARETAASHAQDNIGFYSLTLPTGLGKTLTSIYWALLHAKHHQLHRIIIVLPFINIIDQTAALLKHIFGEELVLEHHSGILDESEVSEEQGNSPKRLACENWDYPVIITTSVQFFETLFSNRPFKCRKLHNIAESVVVFDEIQTLPKTISEPTVTMLKNVSSVMRSSMLFCTATQPVFMKRDGFDGIESIIPLIDDREKYFTVAERVRYTLHKECTQDTIENIAGAVNSKGESVLIITNTKRAARELFDTVSVSGCFERTYHLSTSMCPKHRRKILTSIKDDLQHNVRICAVSTQLVEAGVDIDFPCVFRMLAPLDALIQSAGRCNRNGMLGRRGDVIIFNLENSTWPDPAYRAGAEFTLTKIMGDIDYITRYTSFGDYYSEVLRHLEDQDRSKINPERLKFNFQVVNDRYHVIKSPTAPLFIINYDDESKALFTSMTKETFMPKATYRKTQEYSVLVYPDFIKKYSDQIETFQNTIYIWHGEYDRMSGIDPKYVDVDNSVI